jgi:Tfp pilus assembly protein PilO
MAKLRKKKAQAKFGQVIIVKFYWVIVLVVFIAALFFEYFILIKPQVEQLRNGGELDLEARQNILKEQKNYLAKLQQLKEESDKINRTELEKINYVLARKISVPDILNQIKILSEQSDLEMTNFSFEYGGKVLTLNMKFEKGTYHAVKEYLSQIEKNIRIMDIKEISISNVGGSLSLTIQSYYMEE